MRVTAGSRLTHRRKSRHLSAARRCAPLEIDAARSRAARAPALPALAAACVAAAAPRAAARETARLAREAAEQADGDRRSLYSRPIPLKAFCAKGRAREAVAFHAACHPAHTPVRCVLESSLAVVLLL